MHNGLTKTEQVANYLRQKIGDQAFADGKLPRELDLCRELAVGRITVRNALDRLEREDLIERKKHAGTFVKARVNEVTLDRQVGILMRTQGHMSADIYHFTVQKLMECGLTANVVSTSGIEVPPFSLKPIARAVEKLVNSRLYGLIIDGYVHGRIPLIKELRKKAPVFFDFYDLSADFEPPPTGVWFDYEKAGYLAGKYLMENNCRHPLLVGHPLPDLVRFNPSAYGRHREKQIVDGFRKALLEYGLENDSYVLGTGYSSREDGEEIIANLIRNKSVRPDGIVFSADSLAIKPLKLILALGLRVPSDIRIVGMNNTPWSNEMALHPFPSIDFQPKKIAAALVEMVMTRPEERKNVYIEPELIIRN